MNPKNVLKLAKEAINRPDAPLLDTENAGELAPLAELINELIQKNRSLRSNHKTAVTYLRQKIDQLLKVIGTIPLRAEELDDETLINLDPIGIIATSFSQILDHQRQTNEKLELAMEENQAIFEAVGGGILVLDRDKHILTYNRRFEAMFSIAGTKLIGSTCEEILCQSEHPYGCAFDEMMKIGKAFTVEDCPKNNRHYSVVASPVKDKEGNIVRVVLLYLDNTEFLENRAAAVEEKERLAITLESIAEGVIATDMEGCITLMNQAAETQTGWRLKDALGKPICQIFEILDEREQKPCSDIFLGLLRDGGKVERIDNTVLKAQDKTERLISVSAAPIRRQDHSASGTILVFRDITQEKKLEEELIKSARIDSLGILAGGIAHDFNNLLTSILGNVSLAKTQTNSEDKIYDLLTETENASYLAKNLTHQLLTFSKGGSPLTTLTSASDLIVESATFSSRGAKIKCDFAIPDDLWPVEVDEGQVGQVIQNLVINADQAMQKSGRVYIRAENILIDEKDGIPLSNGRYIKISVKDEGKGIQKQFLDKIFDPYFTTKQAGQGLGLAICYSIIKKHQGLISVESELGVGSTFYIYLPASEDEIPEKLQTEVKKNLGSGKILLMDDEALVRDVAAEMLNHFGYQVDSSKDGEEAIELYVKARESRQPYDAIIMDLTIPGGMGGQEALEKLLEIDPDVKAIVSSGYANDPIMSDFKKYGFVGVVPKPYSIDELGEILHAVIPIENE